MTNIAFKSVVDIIAALPRSEILDASSPNYVLNQLHVVEKLKKLCIDNLSSWSTVNDHSIDISPLTGGASNIIFQVSLSFELQGSIQPSEVLLRIFGQSSFGIRRELELECISLAQVAGLCPACLCSFPGGRIEEFVGNSRNWTAVDLRNVEKSLILVCIYILYASSLPVLRSCNFISSVLALPIYIYI